MNGLRLREVNEEWICEEVITPDRLTLVEAGLSPDDAEAWLDAQRREEPDRAGPSGDMNVTFRISRSEDSLSLRGSRVAWASVPE